MRTGRLKNSGSTLGIAGACLAAIGLKVALQASGSVPFNADEAIVALMARHILMGERPIFFYGQAYMGSLDAFLVAGGFGFFGEEVWVIRAVQTILYLGTLISTAVLGRLIFKSWIVGVLAAWLLAIPSVNVTLYTTVSLGGYVEALLIGNLIMIAALRIGNSDDRLRCHSSGWQWLALGFLAGLGLWVFGMTLVYTLPAFAYLAWRWQHSCTAGLTKPSKILQVAAITTLGLILGAAPWLIYGIGHGITSLVSELGGSTIAGIEGLSWPQQTLRHMLNLVLFGSTAVFGLRPPWELSWLAIPLLPVALAFWISVITHHARWSLDNINSLRRINQPEWLLTGVGLTLILGFILTPFGADPTGRYFLPLAVILALFASRAMIDWQARWGNAIWLCLPAMLIFHLWGTAQVAAASPAGLTTQLDMRTRSDPRQVRELFEFLQAEGELRGYSSYWVSYPVAFLSQESIIFTPRLPYHLGLHYNPRDNRYPVYDRVVAKSDRVAYITMDYPALDNYLRLAFGGMGVCWEEKAIGNFRIFYRLSRPVYLEEVGL